MMRPFEGFTPSRAGTREFGDTALRNAGAAADMASAGIRTKADIEGAKRRAAQYVADAGKQAKSIVDDARTGAITGAITSAIPFGSMAKGSGGGSFGTSYKFGGEGMDFANAKFGIAPPDLGAGLFR